MSYGAKHERKSQYANYLAYLLSHYPARPTSQRQRLGYPGPAHPAFFRTMHADGASPCWSENWHQPASWTLYDNKRTRKRMHRAVAYTARTLLYARSAGSGDAWQRFILHCPLRMATHTNTHTHSYCRRHNSSMVLMSAMSTKGATHPTVISIRLSTC